MKRISSGVVVLLVAMGAVRGSTLSSGQEVDPNAAIRERFIGAWRLAFIEVAEPDGKVRRGDDTGMFVFTRDGHAAVQVMSRTPPSAPTAGPPQYAQGGYEATFGRFEVDARTGTFTYYVEGSLVRTLVGKALPRAYEFTGNQLVVRSTNPAERWRAVWERY